MLIVIGILLVLAAIVASNYHMAVIKATKRFETYEKKAKTFLLKLGVILWQEIRIISIWILLVLSKRIRNKKSLKDL